MFDLDTPENVMRANAFIDTCEPAIAGSSEGANNWTYKTAAMLRDFGLSEEKVFEVMCEHKGPDGETWNERCDPYWETDEIQRMIGNAFKFSKRVENLQAEKSAAWDRFESRLAAA